MRRVLGSIWRSFRSLDGLLFIPVLWLMVLGVLSVESATSEMGGGLSQEAWNQLIYMGISIIVIVVASRMSMSFFNESSLLFYLVVLVALVLVLFVGTKVSGSRRWLTLGFFRFQPSEVMKIALILFMARQLQVIHAFERVGLRRLLTPLLAIGVPTGLVLVEPDLGTALVIFGIGVCTVLMCRVDYRLLLVSLIIGVISAPLVYQFGLKDYQRQRVISFLKPSEDPQGSGYNAIQSMIAIGSGRLTGKGYLRGTQSRLHFIPEQHTDFVFSAFSEEWGFVGVVFLLLLYALVCFRILKIAAEGPTAFATLFCLAYAVALLLQVFVNLAMVSGLFPVVGLSLPFMSYGGSSLVSNALAIGICLAIKRQQRMFESETLELSG